jgi:hypothetical protein
MLCYFFLRAQRKAFLFYLKQGICLKFVNTAVLPAKPIFPEANYIWLSMRMALKTSKTLNAS